MHSDVRFFQIQFWIILQKNKRKFFSQLYYKKKKRKNLVRKTREYRKKAKKIWNFKNEYLIIEIYNRASKKNYKSNLINFVKVTSS